MPDQNQYLTKEKLVEIKKELEDLKSNKRREITEQLEYAKKLGDLSENAEYHEARAAQGELEDRIMRLEDLVKRAIIVDGSHGDRITIGSTAVVKKDGDNDTKSFKIVGSEEADMTNGKISNLSPIGSALIGKSKGDIFSVKTPKGLINYTVVEIK